MTSLNAGFEEIEHTADWALRVWAPDLPGLFAQAARGMYALMETTLAPGERNALAVAVEGLDAESLLVAFLSELLYLGESQSVGCDDFGVSFHEGGLTAQVQSAPILRQKKEIKAVTYHNLQIQERDGLFWVTIVFDV